MLHALVVYTQDNNLLSDSINTRKKSTHDLLNDIKEVDTKARAHKYKYMFMSHHQSAGQSNNIE
jgi:hypothetical protein